MSSNPSVERKHYKLWISSSNVLQTILNSAIIGRSKHKLEEVIEESCRYVITESHILAMDKLEKIHSVIITGSPGVGKTTLADQLCQYYTAKGFEFCYIENSLNEAEQIYREDASQAFYFDDFLGRNFLLALDSHQDSHVINFIKRVERDSKKRFILTSRSNILNQGKQLSDLFEIKKINRNEYELSIALLSDFDKAKILYNHIWFGGLSEEYVDQLYQNKRYIQIIKHNNFNPRLISFITDPHRLLNIKPENYWNYISSNLSNPKYIWRNVFDVQVDDISRHIVVAISLHGQSITEDNLKSMYSGLASSEMVAKPVNNYNTVVRLLVGALLNRNVIANGRVSYDLFNPSIADYVISTYLNEFTYTDQLLSYLRTPQSISNLYSLMESSAISLEYYFNLLESQLLTNENEKDSYKIDSYKLRILFFLSKLTTTPNDELKIHILRFANAALACGPCSFGINYFGFIDWAYSLNLIRNDDNIFKNQLKYWVFEYEKDINEFIPISKLVVAVDFPPSDLTAKLKEQYIDCLTEDITSDAIDAGILSSEYDSNNYDHSKILDYVESRLSDLAIEFDESEIELVSESCDVDEIIQSNVESASHEDHQYEAYREERYNNSSVSDAIDDLFDRS